MSLILIISVSDPYLVSDPFINIDCIPMRIMAEEFRVQSSLQTEKTCLWLSIYSQVWEDERKLEIDKYTNGWEGKTRKKWGKETKDRK